MSAGAGDAAGELDLLHGAGNVVAQDLQRSSPICWPPSRSSDPSSSSSTIGQARS